VFVARDHGDGKAVGIGALKDVGHDAGGPHRRGQAHVHRSCRARFSVSARTAARRDCARARDSAIERLVLETGVGEGLSPPSGFTKIMASPNVAPSLDYPDSGYSRFFEKKLSA
jgi:putative acetyltransferase